MEIAKPNNNTKLSAIKTARKPKAPENETPEQKFVRLGQARMTKCLKTIEQVGRLGKASQYKHDKRGIRIVKMKEALLKAIQTAIPDQSTTIEAGFKIE